MSSNDNRLRAFSDSVTVEAWHKQFDGLRSVVDLHADVAFSEARVGGEEGSPVRFRLSVRRAELVVVVPEVEPVSVVPGSVSRDTPDVIGRRMQASELRADAGLRMRGSLTALPGAALPLFEGEARAELAASESDRTELTTTLSAFRVMQSQTPDGDYRWVMEPTSGDRLLGHPWDAAEAPRLKLEDRRRRLTELPAVVRVEVRCRREDLIVEKIVVKDESIWEKVQNSAGLGNKMAAAESYIRDRLLEVGLEFDNIQDPFGQLTLASITAKES